MNSNKVKYLASIVNRIIKETINSNVYEISLLFKKVLDVYVEGNVENDKILEAINKSLLINASDTDPSPAHPPFHLHAIIIDLGLFLPGDTLDLYINCFYLMNKRLHIKLMTLMFHKEEYWELHIDELLLAMFEYQNTDDFDLLLLRDKLLKKLLKFDGCVKILQCIANGSPNVVNSACQIFNNNFIRTDQTNYFKFPKAMSIKDLLLNINEYISITNVEYHIIQRNALTTPKAKVFHMVALYMANRCCVCRKIIWGFTAYASKRDVYHLNCIYDNKARLADDDVESFNRVYRKLLNQEEQYSDNEKLLIIDLLVLQYILLHRANEYPDLKQLLFDGISHFKGLEMSTKKLFFSDANNVYPLYHSFSKKHFDQARVPFHKMMSFFKDIIRKVIQQHILDLNVLFDYLSLKNDLISLDIPVFNTDSNLNDFLIKIIENSLKSSNNGCHQMAWWLIKHRCHPVAFKSDSSLFKRLLLPILDWYKSSSSDQFHTDYYDFMNQYRVLFPNTNLPLTISDKSSTLLTPTSVVYHLQTNESFDAKSFFKAVKNPKVPFIYQLDDHGKKQLGELLQMINKDAKLTLQLNAILFKYRINTSLTWITLMTKILDSEDALVLGQLVLLNFRVSNDVPFNRIKPILEWLSNNSRVDVEFQVIYLKIFATLLGCSTETQNLVFTPNKPRKTPLIPFDFGSQYIRKFIKQQPLLSVECFLLATKIVQVYYNVDQCPQFIKSILNQAWHSLDYEELKQNYQYASSIAFLLKYCKDSSFLQDEPKTTQGWLLNLNKINYFLDVSLFAPSMEQTDYTTIMALCCNYIYKSMFHDDPLIRHAGSVMLQIKVACKEWNMRLINMDSIFVDLPLELLHKTIKSFCHICKHVPICLLTMTKLLDVLGRLSTSTVPITNELAYRNDLIELMCLHCVNDVQLSDPELIVIKYLMAIHLGFKQCKIQGLQLQIGPFQPVNSTNTVLMNIRMIIDRQVITTSRARTLQIESCLLVVQGAIKALKMVINTKQINDDIYPWLEAAHVGLYYNCKHMSEGLLIDLFVSLLDVCFMKYEMKEFILFLLQFMIEQIPTLLMTYLQRILTICFDSITRLSVNFKDNLGKRGFLFLAFVLQQQVIRDDFYSFLAKDNVMMDYIQIMYDVESKQRLLSSEIVMCLNWEELRIDFYNKLLIYGIDSLVDVGHHFQQFVKISQDIGQYTQPHAIELTRIIDDILKRSATIRIKDECAGYFLASIGGLIEEHGYLSILMLENLRFNLDSFLCSFDVVNEDVIEFFDILKSVDVDLFEFTMITIFKSTLKKNMQNRAYSSLCLKYLPELVEVLSINNSNLALEEIMEHSFNHAKNDFYLEIGFLVCSLQGANSFQISKLSRNRVLNIVIVLFYSGFKCNNWDLIQQITKQHLEISKMVLESTMQSGKGGSTYQSSSKQSVAIQLFLIFKLTSFMQRHVLTTDTHLVDNLLTFEYALWNGIYPILADIMQNDLVLKAGMDLFEFTTKCNARMNYVIANGLQDILESIDVGEYAQRYNKLKQSLEANGIMTPGNSAELWRQLDEEIKQLN